MIDTYFKEEHKLFRDSLRDFLQKEVVPHVDDWEQTGVIDRAIWNKFGETKYQLRQIKRCV